MTARSFARIFDASCPRRSPSRLRRLRARGEAAGLVGIASPLALIELLNMALGLTDVVMVGRHDPDGLAAIVMVSDLYSIIFNFTAGLAAVVVPHVAAALGAGVPWQVCTIVQRVVLLVCLVAALGIAAIWHAGALVAATGVRLDAPEVTGSYAQYMAGAYFFMVLFAFGRHPLSAVARARAAVLAIAAALPLNVLTNHACMTGAFGWPGLGAAGAGLASLLVAMLMAGSVVGFLFLSPPSTAIAPCRRCRRCCNRANSSAWRDRRR